MTPEPDNTKGKPMTDDQPTLPQEIDVVPQDTPLARVQQTPMQLIETLVANGGDVEKLGQLMDLQERWERNEAAKEYHAALAAFQAECPVIPKTREVSFKGVHAYNYAAYEDIMLLIRPLLKKHSLAVKFSASTADGMMTVECTIRRGIHCEVSSVTFPVPSDMRVNDTQKAVAAVSYGKRASLTCGLNIVVSDEDTDGAGLCETIGDGQQAALTDLLNMIGDRVLGDRFFDLMGVDNVSEIPVSRFNEALTHLQSKTGTGGPT